MKTSQTNKEPLSPLELERLFDSLDSEGKEILTNQMMLLNTLTNRIQQLHTELLERIDSGEKLRQMISEACVYRSRNHRRMKLGHKELGRSSQSAMPLLELFARLGNRCQKRYLRRLLNWRRRAGKRRKRSRAKMKNPPMNPPHQ